jgi:2-polyprenyl-6-methoxyphenol hydroxylase-like FAD-dependent oxidoreductase
VRAPRALIIGGSLGGLFAAHLLRSIGWDIRVFERSAADLSGRGAGLGTRGELASVLGKAGIELGRGAITQVRSRILLDESGSIAAEIPICSLATAWDRVYGALRQALPSRQYHAGKHLRSFEQDAGSIFAHFADGTRAEGELLVGADGVHSVVRAQVMPDVQPRYAGYVGWRGAASQADLPEAFRQLMFNHMNFFFGERHLALSVPMPAPAEPLSAGESRVQITWFRPADADTTLRQLCTDSSGRRHGSSIPPALIRQECIAELKAAAAELAPQMTSLIRGLKQPLLQPIYDFEAPRMVFGRAVLLGDAAFVARPHVGTGVTKAALDADGLARALSMHSSDIHSALARYEAERSAYGQRLVARGRALGAWLEGSSQADRCGQPRDGGWRERLIGQFGAAGEEKLSDARA